MDIHGIRTEEEAERVLRQRSRSFNEKMRGEFGSVLFVDRFGGGCTDVAIWFEADRILTIW